MDSSILLNWKFWVSFYFLLCCSWSFLIVVEYLIKTPLALLISYVFVSKLRWTPQKLEAMLDSGLGRLFFDLFFLIRYLTYSMAFIGGVNAKLLTWGIKSLTFEHTFCLVFAFLFSYFLHYVFALAPQRESGYVRIDNVVHLLLTFLPTIAFAFILYYFALFKFPVILMIFSKLGSIVCQIFLIKWLPWLFIAICWMITDRIIYAYATFPFMFPYLTFVSLRTIFEPTAVAARNYRKILSMQLSEVSVFEVRIARRRLNSFLTYEIVKNPTYPIEELDKKLAWKNLDSLFAKGIIQNPSYTVCDKDIEIAKKNSNTKFAQELFNRIKQNKESNHQNG